jgi:hypothetical protein
MIAKKLRGRLSWCPLLIHVYFEDETGLGDRLPSCFTKDEARRIAVKHKESGP